MGSSVTTMWIGLLLIILIIPLNKANRNIITNYNDTCTSYIAQGDDPELCITVLRNTHRNKTIKQGTSDVSFTYNIGNDIQLTCEKKWPSSKEQKDTSLVKWILKRQNHQLLETPTKEFYNNKEAYTVDIVLDQFDNDLIAACESRSERWNITLEVRFQKGLYEREQKHNTTDSIQIIREFEDEPIQNNHNRTVMVYNNYNNLNDFYFVDPDDNIFDSLTAKNNQSMYTFWFKKKQQNNNYILKKEKRTIFVLPLERPKSKKSKSIIAVVIGVLSSLVIILLITFIYIKYYKRRETQDETYAQIYTDPTRVVYAQVDLKASDNPVPNRPEEPYAQIIGVLKPKRKPIKTDQPKSK